MKEVVQKQTRIQKPKKTSKPAFLLRDTTDFSLSRQDTVSYARQPRADDAGVLLGVLLVYLCTLSFLYIFASAVGTQPDALPVFLFSALTTLLWCSFRVQSKSINLFSTFGILLLACILLWNHAKIADGFFYCIQDLYDTIKIHNSSIEFRVKHADYGYSTATTWLFCTAALLVSGGAALGSFLTKHFLILFLFTFPLLEIPLYWGLVPEYPAFFLGLICWIVALLSSTAIFKYKTNNPPRKKSFVFADPTYASHAVQKQLALSSAAITTAVVFLAFLINAIFPYERPDQFNTVRRDVHSAMSRFSEGDIFGGIRQFNNSFASLFPFGSSSGSFQRGKLGDKSSIRFSGSTALEVTASQPVNQNVYLKSFAASEYTGHSWELPDDDTQDQYENELEAIFGSQQPTQVLMDALSSFSAIPNSYTLHIHNVRAGKETYKPYLSAFQDESNDEIRTMDFYTYLGETQYSVGYYEISNQNLAQFSAELSLSHLLSSAQQDIAMYTDDDTLSETLTKFQLYNEYAYRNFLEIDQTAGIEQVLSDISLTVQTLKEENQVTDNSYSESNLNNYRLAVASALANYFDANFSYSLSPGKTPSDKDFVDYFLSEQKQGYCTYFASAGVLLMRALGVPARYAEGYVLDPSEKYSVNQDGDYTYTISDKSAHAWTEIYLDGAGWVPVEFTPGYSSGYNPNNTAVEQSTTVSTTKPMATTTSGTQKKTDTNTNSSSSAPVSSGSAVTSSENSDQPSHVPLYSLIFAIFILAILFGLLQRPIRLYLTKRSLRVEYPEQTVANAFRMALRYLALCGLTTETQKTDLQNAQALAERFLQETGTDISTEMEQLAHLALRAALSATVPNKSDAQDARAALRHIADAVYQSLNRTGKWIAKYIYALY